MKDNPALTAFKYLTGAGLLFLAVTNADAVAAGIRALLSVLTNMFALVTGAWRGPSGGGLQPGTRA